MSPAVAFVSLSAPTTVLAVLVAFVVVATTLLHGRRTTSRHATTTMPLRTLHTLPDSRFLVGDLFAYIKNAERFHDWLMEVSARFHHEPWCLRIGGQKDLIVVSTPEALDDVLIKQHDKFPRGEYANLVMEGVLGRSLLSYDGDEWHRQRKTGVKFFTARALRVCMLTTMRKNVYQMYDVLDQHVASGDALDLSTLLGHFALQTFAEVGLGADLRWIGTNTPHPIKDVAADGSTTVMRRFRVPAFWWKLEKMLNVGPEKKLAVAMATTREWLHMLISTSLNALATRHACRPSRPATASDNTTIKSVVELFFEHSQEDKTGLRAEDMVDFILTFVLSSQDTSSLTLTRFFLMVMKHPHVEHRIRREMEAVLPSLGATKETYLTTDHVQHLVYLEATIKEVLRLYPTAPLVQREVGEDTVICGNVPVHKGAAVCLQFYTMARNPGVWGPDAAEFKPERWIDQATGELRSFPPTKFATFGAGPHMCIGMKLGMLELRVVTANLVHRYGLSLAVPNDGDYLVAVTLMMKKPLIVHVQPATGAEA